MQEFMLIYKGGNPDFFKTTPKEEIEATMARWGEWMEGLSKTDQLVSGGSPLEWEGKNITEDGLVTDIAAAELKELVTGYSIVKAQDMDAAIVIAKACPIFNYPGCAVQLRQVVSMG